MLVLEVSVIEIENGGSPVRHVEIIWKYGAMICGPDAPCREYLTTFPLECCYYFSPNLVKL